MKTTTAFLTATSIVLLTCQLALSQQREAKAFTMPYIPEEHDREVVTPVSVMEFDRMRFGSRNIGELDPELVDRALKRDVEEKNYKFRVGLKRDLGAPISVRGGQTSDGGWGTASDGCRVWATFVDAPGALGQKLLLENVKLPEGAAITVYDTYNPDRVAGPYTAADVTARRTLHPGLVFSESITIECCVPDDATMAGVEFDVTHTSHVFRLSENSSATGTPYVAIPPGALDCADADYLDFQCFDGDANDDPTENWFNEGQSVALVIIGGVGSCSGNLLADCDTATIRYFFMTANHCVANQGQADTTEYFWFYESATCNADGVTGAGAPTDTDLGRAEHTDGGAMLWATSHEDLGFDCTLMELNTAAPPGTTFLPWEVPGNSTRIIGEEVVGISHPGGSRKFIHFGTVVNVDQAWPQGDESYTQVEPFNGLAQQGSSGSPLIDRQGNYMGPLSKGEAGQPDCADPTAVHIVYGRFDMFYDDVQAIIDNCDGGGGGPGGGAVTGEGWINEISYDVYGDDNGFTTSNPAIRREGVEVALRAGALATDFLLAFYDFAGTHYATVNLTPSPHVPNLSTGCLEEHNEAGFGVLWFNMPEQSGGIAGEGFIRNSGGVALVRAEDHEVLDFRSFDRDEAVVLIANDGPAIDAQSTNLGVHQDGTLSEENSPEGFTLQAAGGGTNGVDFVFQDPMPMTPGQLNNAVLNQGLVQRFISQSFGCLTNDPPVLVDGINIDVGPPADIDADVLAGSAPVIQFSAADPEGDPVTFAFEGAEPEGLALQQDGNSVTITYDLGLESVGEHSVDVRITDHFGASVVQTINYSVTVDMFADTDNDTIVDVWELINCDDSLNNCRDVPNSQGGNNFDFDGLTDVEEFIADTRADDPASGAVITPECLPDGSHALKFLASTEREYTVQFRDDLSDPWEDLPGFIGVPGAPDGGEARGLMTVVDPNAGNGRVYRFKVDLPQAYKDQIGW